MLNLNLSYALILNDIYWNTFYEKIEPFEYIIEFFKYLKQKKIQTL